MEIAYNRFERTIDFPRDIEDVLAAAIPVLATRLAVTAAA